jgi:hypothetical protein
MTVTTRMKSSSPCVGRLVEQWIDAAPLVLLAIADFHLDQLHACVHVLQFQRLVEIKRRLCTHILPHRYIEMPYTATERATEPTHDMIHPVQKSLQLKHEQSRAIHLTHHRSKRRDQVPLVNSKLPAFRFCTKKSIRPNACSHHHHSATTCTHADCLQFNVRIATAHLKSRVDKANHLEQEEDLRGCALCFVLCASLFPPAQP